MQHRFALSHDPTASRFDSSMLPDQTMMELLFQGFDESCQNAMKRM